MKRKTLAILLLTCMLVICSLSLIACKTDVHTHELKKVDAKAATCEVAGNIEYYHCEGCNKYFSDEQYTEITLEETVMAALGHEEVPHDGKAATCTEKGYKAYVTCSRCEYSTKEEIPALDHDYKEEVTTPATCVAKGVKTITCERDGCDYSTTKEIEIDKNAHTLEHHDGKAATCTEDGSIEYWSCSLCNKNFSDKNGATEVEKLKIDKLGEEYLFEYLEGLKVKGVKTLYANAVPQDVNGGTILSQLSTKTRIRFGINASAAKETELFVYSLIRVDEANSSKAADRFTLKVNGVAVDLSAITIKGVTHEDNGDGGWWKKKYSGTSLGKINLVEGENIIELTASSEMNVDYFYFDKLVLDYPSFDYQRDAVIEGEATYFMSANTQEVNGGKVLSELSKNTEIKFFVNSKGDNEVDFYVYALIRVDNENSAKASDRFTLKINGNAVDLSSIIITGVTHENNAGWWTKNYSHVSLGKIKLDNGENLVEITASSEMNIDYFCFDAETRNYPVFNYKTRLKVEAENTSFVNAKKDGAILGSLSKSSEIKFYVKSEAEKQTEFFVNAVIRVDDDNPANASERFTLKVNGIAVDLSAITITGVTHENSAGWWTKAYSGVSLGEITLLEGKNLIEITTSSEMNIDYFYFDDIPYPEFDYTENLKIEAEDALYSGALLQEANGGTILGDLKPTSTITFIVNAEEIKEVELFVCAVIKVDETNSSKAAERFTVKVNGTPIDLSAVTIEGVSDWDWWTKEYSPVSLGKINLVGGDNMIEIVPSAEMNIDYFVLG